ncbi:hypothetical protein WR25_05245 [Diploscapter pachys]|uniref:CWH43-like N-terminal domain-containing protein n=1 Tax=Diploscapter pachys TaxID=2018661 RepID=A0A2A2LQW1_9BILA|nr:hypothetical protein WR25_05245 [Diploscapter pachys]
MVIEKKSMLPPLDDAVAHSQRFITIVCLAAFLPGLGCYFCVAYSFFFQLDTVLNFTHAFPPVSYSIGIWKPQRYIWLLILFVHLPPRIIFIVLYRRLFYTFSHEAKAFEITLKFYALTLWLEPSGLILVSVIDIKSHFIIHAIAYAMWIIFFNFNMLLNVILTHFSGFKQTHPKVVKVWWFKLLMLISGIAISISTPFTYFYFLKHCNVVAYTLFSVAECIMVGYNAVFYALSYYEFPSTRITVGVRSKASLTSRTFSTTSTVQSSTGSNSSYEKGTNHIPRST